MIRDTFSNYHPILNFAFYIGAFVFGMFFLHPMFLLCSFLFSGTYYLTIKGLEGMKYIGKLLPLYLLIAAINPIFNTYGKHILFTYMNGRPYTGEALGYGFALATMVISVLLWFSSYNIVITSDKFLYLFGKLIPSVSLILTMVLRLIPTFEKKATQISVARKGIGKSVENGTMRERAENATTILSTLTIWALEGGIVMADSMKSRGYGSGKRTSFSIYKFEKRDVALLSVMLLLMVSIVVCAINGAASVDYIPEFSMKKSMYSVVGVTAYAVFLVIPTSINILEDIRWYILRSKI